MLRMGWALSSVDMGCEVRKAMRGGVSPSARYSDASRAEPALGALFPSKEASKSCGSVVIPFFAAMLCVQFWPLKKNSVHLKFTKRRDADQG